jgi:hypothetical protein
MTIQERYQDLTQPLTVFGKTYPAKLDVLTIDGLLAYANELYNTGHPLAVHIAKQIRTNVFNAGNNLAGTI